MTLYELLAKYYGTPKITYRDPEPRVYKTRTHFTTLTTLSYAHFESDLYERPQCVQFFAFKDTPPVETFDTLQEALKRIAEKHKEVLESMKINKELPKRSPPQKNTLCPHKDPNTKGQRCEPSKTSKKTAFSTSSAPRTSLKQESNARLPERWKSSNSRSPQNR